MSKLFHIDKIELNVYTNAYIKTSDLYINQDYIAIIEIDNKEDFAYLYDSNRKAHRITKKRAIEIIEIINGD